MYETILVPTDGSDHAERAAGHAFALAAAFDATVHVRSVADVSDAAGPFNAGGVSEEFVERVESDAESVVESTAALAPDDVAVETAVSRGQPGEEILATIDDVGADLVVMGTQGRRGLSRLVTGSVCEHVVRNAPVPVVTARVTDDDPVTDYEQLLIPTDGSDEANAAVAHGIAVADAVDASVHVLNVIDLGTITSGSDVAAASALIDQLRERGADATEAVAEQARDAGLDVTTEVREGFPNADLLECIDREGIDFVAMGTHGRTGVERLLLGSTTERTIRRSPVPVLSVPPGEREESD